LAASAARLVGLDVTAQGVDTARCRGYEAHQVDCTSASEVRALGLTPFDVVLAGEVIEHVDNPGGLLEAATELASRDGVLIVTTPNAHRLMDVFLAASRRELIHPDHVALHSPRTLSSMLERHDWEVVEYLGYMNPRSARPSRTPQAFILQLGNDLARGLAVTMFPYLADGLIAVARRHPSLSNIRAA
jgi:hypothetical protein